MPVRAAEDALVALETVLDAIVGPTYERNTILPESIPSGGLIILRDGAQGSPYTTTLNPVVYSYKHLAEIEVYVKKADQSTRDTAMDTLLQQIADAISADRTLGGVITRALPYAPDFTDDVFAGSEQIKAALVPVELDYDTTDPLK